MSSLGGDDSEGWKVSNPSGSPRADLNIAPYGVTLAKASGVDLSSIAVRVSQVTGFVEGPSGSFLDASPSVVVIRDQVLSPRARGTPKKVQNRGGKKKGHVVSFSGFVVANGRERK